MKIVVWKSKSSAWLYFYQNAFFFGAAFVLSYWNPLLSLLPLAGLVMFIVDAKTMKYELSESEIYFSPSLFDREAATLSLEDIVGLYVVDQQPWSFFSLGTVLLLTDFTNNEQPCIKCVKNPYKLAELIKRQALSSGAKIESEYT